jgi:glycosyltransferase involved in cell wall biosynthesis
MPEVAGGAALLADPEKPESIAAQMQKIADNPDLRMNLSTEGLQRSHAFSWQASAETIYQALKRCSS